MSSINNELDLRVKIFVLNLIMFWTGVSVFCLLYFNIFKKKKEKEKLESMRVISLIELLLLGYSLMLIHL